MTSFMTPCIYLQSEKAVTGFGQRNLFGSGNPVLLAGKYSGSGADRILVFDFSKGDKAHEKAISIIREICAESEVPVLVSGNIRRLEDVKKLLYAGCQGCVVSLSQKGWETLLPEVSRRFGKEKILAGVSDFEEFLTGKDTIEEFASEVLALDTFQEQISEVSGIPVLVHTDISSKEEILHLLKGKNVSGVSGEFISTEERDIRAFKEECSEAGIMVSLLQSRIGFEEFKLNGDGLIPVVVQDYKNDQVLMVAYMNQEAYEQTVRTGKMTYFSRSRQKLWVKGETSGHFQYVKGLFLDCDNDTILAKVDQIGAACHTGARSCFFQTLLDKGEDTQNPLHVFQDVYDVILDRKKNPREGSYTNYLFDKGLDKILKKVGEEATEIVIAAKNPDKEEIKYEISDFLYHMMVLMAEKGVTWDEITGELAQR